MKTTWRRLVKFANVAQTYTAKEDKDTKLKYAISRVLAQLESIQNKINLKLSKLAVDNALEYEAGEKAGALMRDEKGNYMYSKAGANALEEGTAALLDEHSIEFEPYFATKIPELEIAMLEAFRGIVIKDEYVNKTLADLEAKWFDGSCEDMTSSPSQEPDPDLVLGKIDQGK